MLEDKTNNLLDAIKQFNEHIYESTEIFLGNPDDLFKMDMTEIPSCCVFMSNFGVEKGRMLRCVDDTLKRELYEFIEEHLDRVFRGRKQRW